MSMKYLEQANAFLAREFPDKHTDIIPSHVIARLKKQLIKVTKQKQSTKAEKSNKLHDEYYNLILYLIPANLIGAMMCVNWLNCVDGCLVWSGQGGTYSTMRSRVIKTLGLLNFPDKFKERLSKDVILARKATLAMGKQLVLRLNGTSDLHPRRFGIDRGDIIRYEYTKSLAYALAGESRGIHMTYSHYGKLADTLTALRNGINISLVLEHGQELPEWAHSYNIIDGDEHDLRFLDEKQSIVLLRAKRGGFGKSDKRTRLSEVA